MSELSKRELQVLKLTAWDCLSAKEVADELSISPMTAQNHIRNIKEKLNLQKVSELCKHYYVNIYASILLVVVTPTVLPHNIYRGRLRSSIRATQRVRSRRNERDFEFDYQLTN